jgi:hypothetical protein
MAMLSFSAEYQYERVEHEFEFGFQDVKNLKTSRVLFGINVYHPSGLTAKIKPAYVHQEGDFVSSSTLVESTDTDNFWVVDASLGYRLPRRFGIITLEAKNLFDEDFNFQDTDPRNPRIMPDQLILGKFTVSY